MKIYESDPSVDRSIRKVRQLEQGFEPCRMMLKLCWGERGVGAAAVCIIKVFLQKKENEKSTTLFCGETSYLRIFALRGVMEPTTVNSED